MKLTEIEAQKIIHAIWDELKTRNKQAIIAVTDAHGELLAFLRMEKVKLSSIAIAQNKAYTSARTKRTSFEVGKNSTDPITGYDIAFYGDQRIVGFGGGVPIWHNDEVIGAVGVSGLSQEEDDELARIGVAILEFQPI
jgi:glc operon protein GlcG